jgi:quinohemoprotein ethanol dehydrogenase
MRVSKPGIAVLAAVIWLVAAGVSADPGQVTRDRLMNLSREPGQWLSRGRDWTGQFYSPLDRINTANVTRLGVAWEYDASPRRGRVLRGLEATPIVVDGVMYASLAWSEVVALDARTGTELWRYDPKADGASDRRGCCDMVNRGVAVWKGRVYVGTVDGFLVALDAKDGRELWRSDTFVDRTRSYTITGAPQVAGNVVVIGNGGSEFGVRGYVSAFDLYTGALRWRFYTVPGDPGRGFEHPELKMAAKTWDPKSDWITGGGGTAWDGMAYDPRLNLLYFGTGNSNPYPTWFRSPKPSDNLFLASILAINPDTGRLKWYYQTTPGEMWDYDATQPLVLADLQINGRTRNVLMQASKNGFFYVLDRATGKLLSARNFVYVNWASHVDLATGRPVLTGKGWYKDKPKLIFPSQIGGHNWMPMSFSPQTGLIYIPAIDTPMLFSTASSYKYHPGEFNMGAFGALPPIPDKYRKDAPHTEMRQLLLAWDPIAKRAAWKVPQASFYNGGVLSTAGHLVFQGTSSGHFIAYDAQTGSILKDIEIGTGIMAAPCTYEIDGKQYVTVLAGFGGGLLKMFPAGAAARTYRNESRIITFQMDGGPARMSARLVAESLPDEHYTVTASDDTLSSGKTLYMTHCARCHGGYWEDVPSGYPDLKRMAPATYSVFEQIVLDGALRDNGMASFSDVLGREQVQAIQAYLQSETNRLIDVSRAASKPH